MDPDNAPHRPPASAGAGFTGRSRRRTTRRSVLIIDRLSRLFITVGGIGTILAVMGVGVFLVSVVLPLFFSADVEGEHDFAGPWTAQNPPLSFAVDEYRLLGWVIKTDGQIRAFRLDDGADVYEETLFEDGEVTVSSYLPTDNLVMFGLRDGSIQGVKIGFATEIVNADRVPAEIWSQLDVDGNPPVTYDRGVAQRTVQGQVRIQRLQVEPTRRLAFANGPIRALDHVVRSSGPLLVALAEHPAAPPAAAEDAAAGDAGATVGAEAEAAAAAAQDAAPTADAPPIAAAPTGPAPMRLALIVGEEDTNFLTGVSDLSYGEPIDLPYEGTLDDAADYLRLTGAGGDLYVAWQSGDVLRYNLDDVRDAFVAERGRLTPEGVGLSSIDFTLGNNTLIWGDERGRLRGGFTTRAEDYTGETNILTVAAPDRVLRVFVAAKELAAGGGDAVHALTSSTRSRLLLSGDAAGVVKMFNVTNASQLMRFDAVPGQAIRLLAMAPKEDGLALLTDDGVWVADLDPRYPEASFQGLFRPVWYEGYAEPENIWQSSSASDDFEPKLGLLPLIFGTLKATFYSMLFGAPLALLAAIFTSEFLHPRAKSVFKPTIELMASLPSVVLGFLAALVFAPVIEMIVPQTLALFITVPLAILFGAYVWQLLPARTTIRYRDYRIASVAGIALPLGVGAAFVVGPLLEGMLFSGDLKGWLAWDGDPTRADRFANATGGWMMLMLPLAALFVAWLRGKVVKPVLRRRGGGLDRRGFALLDLGAFAGSALAAFVLAFAFSAILNALGFDPRGSYVDTYSQRNALIVGVVMGFAIIPIIYTIAEDALSAVPSHLRSASLGAGATPWQTAVRIVIPTATSGLFSALMIGLGRAVGETMIVLMAAGNTPVMDLNIFEGFRTLSANIAVELPEAVRGSTHYRTLFLAALVLFVMTFIVNTVAEVVRLRFRKRTSQL
ncbi:MAG: ABC transporter permease subunit [Acidobacteriota bacterium]